MWKDSASTKPPAPDKNETARALLADLLPRDGQYVTRRNPALAHTSHRLTPNPHRIVPWVARGLAAPPRGWIVRRAAAGHVAACLHQEPDVESRAGPPLPTASPARRPRTGADAGPYEHPGPGWLSRRDGQRRPPGRRRRPDAQPPRHAPRRRARRQP